MIQWLKKLFRVIRGNDFYYNPTISIDKERIGSEYGGWWISTEFENTKESTVLSFGLGEDISFDIGMMKNFNIKVYGFDPTPKSIEYVQSLKLDEKYSLYKYALSDVNGHLTFNLPENEDHVSASLENISSSSSITVECKNISTILDELKLNKIDILKMDIEGSEYKVIVDMINSKIYPNQILVEYHHFFNSFTNADTKTSIEFLLENGYELFSIDGYNYSFIKRIVDK